MEPWEYTLERAHLTLTVWNAYLPATTVGGNGVQALSALVDGFEPLAQAVVQAEFSYDEANREVQRVLQTMRVLGTKVPALIQAHLEEDELLMSDVQFLFQTAPRTEATILKRARELYPVWLRANAAMAALVPSQPEILRAVQGVPHSAAMLKGLLDGYSDLITVLEDRAKLVQQAKAALRENDRAADRLNKRFYQLAKAGADAGSEIHEALRRIPTEPSTPAPETVEMETVTQGGESGLQVLVAYGTGGGRHATTKLVKWQVAGADAGFVHSAPLEPGGNALGPFAQGQVVRILTESANSAGTRTTAPRTITIGEPVA